MPSLSQRVLLRRSGHLDARGPLCPSLRYPKSASLSKVSAFNMDEISECDEEKLYVKAFPCVEHCQSDVAKAILPQVAFIPLPRNAARTCFAALCNSLCATLTRTRVALDCGGSPPGAKIHAGGQHDHTSWRPPRQEVPSDLPRGVPDFRWSPSNSQGILGKRTTTLLHHNQRNTAYAT